MATPSEHYLAPSRFPWPPVLLAGAVALAVLLGILVPLDWPGTEDPAAHLVGLAIGFAGIALMAWSAIELRRAGTTILPDKAATHLVTTGPFRFRRNPIYIAHVLMLLGVAELTKNIWFPILALVYAVLVTWLAILPEERHLEARFGDAYRDYSARTRRWI
jgi:protein-S-isoprenylcysteine O-methyltransferase Ste14